MAKTVLITLTTAGTDTGPFDLYSDADGYAAPFESGISKAALQAGYTSVLVPNAATIIRVKSVSVLCPNYINLTIVESTTTTTSTTHTTTSTTSTIPVPVYKIWWDVNNDGGHGNLLVYPSASPGSPIINKTTNAISSGNVVVSFGTSYTVKGTWISGSGNTVQFRVCDSDNGVQLYLSPVITNISGPNTFSFTFATLSPSTQNVTVYLRSGGITPPVCPLP